MASAWHARVIADEMVAHAFSHGFHRDHVERLAFYWAEALGGPSTFSDTCGTETSVVRAYSGNGPHEQMNRRAITCFDRALDDVGVTDDPLDRVVHDYVAWATTTTMDRFHESAGDVPAGLRIPRWTWTGPEQDPPVRRAGRSSRVRRRSAPPPGRCGGSRPA